MIPIVIKRVGRWAVYSLKTFYSTINPVAATKTYYKQQVGRELDLSEPKALTEKLQWLKFYQYRHNQTVTKCADKYRVREYVAEKGCSEILNELYGVWTKVEDINWDSLPDKFVLKCTHGCGYNIVCEDKKSFDIKDAKEKLSRWMKQRYGKALAELIYDDIEPRIICEKFIETEDGNPLIDYKIFCSYGKPKLVYVITGGHGDQECLDYYTPEWEWIPVNNGTLPNAGCIVKKPDKLEEMFRYAEALAKDFPIVRVDFYCEFGQIIFGELTFLATGGLSIYKPENYDYVFGEMFPIIEKLASPVGHE